MGVWGKPEGIDEDELVKKHGYRNFVSFVFIFYYDKKFSLKRTGELIGVSSTKIRSSLKKRGFPIRGRGLLPGVAPKNKRAVNIWAKTKQNTNFIFQS